VRRSGVYDDDEKEEVTSNKGVPLEDTRLVD
jgi:hypothetical protein